MADFNVTLAEVYGLLGLYQRSSNLIRKSFAVTHNDAGVRLRQMMVLAENQAQFGRLDAAVVTFKRALQAAGGSGDLAPGARSRILIGLAQAQSALGDRPAADRAARESLRLDLARVGKSQPDVSRDREVLGLNAFYDGDTDGHVPISNMS